MYFLLSELRDLLVGWELTPYALPQGSEQDQEEHGQASEFSTSLMEHAELPVLHLPYSLISSSSVSLPHAGPQGVKARLRHSSSVALLSEESEARVEAHQHSLFGGHSLLVALLVA